jgi:protein-tyrosine sulfotransferase
MEAATPRKPAPGRGPIFIVGPMGTGTTLLRLMLDSHENIAIPHETGFMRIYNAMRFTPFKWSGRYWANRLGWSDEEIDDLAREFFDKIFMRYAHQHGSQRWGEKTPQHLWHVWAMKKLFPDSVFIGMVRHPGAAVVSNMRRFGHSGRWAAAHNRRYSREVARLAALHPNRMSVIRYEDLVLQPEKLMRELLDWLGEPWSDSVLAHHEIQVKRDHHRIEGQARADEPVDASRITKWTTQGDQKVFPFISRVLAGITAYWGYSFEDPARLEPLSDDGRLLFGGPAAKERLARFPELKLEERGLVPAYELLYHPRDVMLLHTPFERPRFVPGERDAALGPAPGTLRLKIHETVKRLPPPMRARVRGAARKVGIKERRLPPPEQPYSDN